MIINRNMQTYTLQEKKRVQNKAGQWVYDWVNIKEIEVAIYPVNYTILTSANIKYSEPTNTGLTTCKDVKEVFNRIVRNNEIYEITFANPIGKYNQLFLKKVIFNE